MASILQPGYLYWDGLKYITQALGPAPEGMAGGDLSGLYPNPYVINLNGNPISATVPANGQVLGWDGSEWIPTNSGADITFAGDLSGTVSNQNVINIHGASVPISGALVTGNVLQVSGISSLTYSAINLAGGSNYISGILPISNGGTGLGSVGSLNQILQSTGSALQYVDPTSISIVAWANDLAGSTSTSQSVVSAQSGAITFATSGLVTWASADTVPSLTQASTTNQTPTAFVVTPQASTNSTTQGGSSFGVALSAVLGEGTSGYSYVSQGGTKLLQIGSIIGSTSTAAIYGPVSPTSTNYTLSTTGAGTVINATSEVVLAISGSKRIDVTATTIAFNPNGTSTALFDGSSGEVSFGYNVEIGSVTGGTYNGATSCINLVNGTAASAGVLNGSLIQSTPTGLNLWAPAAAAGNNAAGSVLVNLGAPTGSGTEAFFQITRNGALYAALGLDTVDGGSPVALYMGAGTDPTVTNNYVLASYGGGASTIVRGGSAVELYGGGPIGVYVTASGTVIEKNLYVGADPGIYGGGNIGVIGIANVTTPISAAVTTGSLIESNAGTLEFYAAAAAAGNNAPGGFLFNIGAPTGSGAEAYASVARAGTNLLQLGQLVGSSGNAAIYGPVTPSATNYAFTTTGAGTVVNGTSESVLAVAGIAQVAVTASTVSFTPDGTSLAQFYGVNGEVAFGYNVAVGAVGGGSYGGGVGGCLYLANATTAPTTAVTTGSLIYTDTTQAALCIKPPTFVGPMVNMFAYTGNCVMEFAPAPGAGSQCNVTLSGPFSGTSTGDNGGGFSIHAQNGDGVSTNGGDIVLSPGSNNGGTGNSGRFNLQNATVDTTAGTGSYTVPITAGGYLEVLVNNTTYKLALYNP